MQLVHSLRKSHRWLLYFLLDLYGHRLPSRPYQYLTLSNLKRPHQKHTHEISVFRQHHIYNMLLVEAAGFAPASRIPSLYFIRPYQLTLCLDSNLVLVLSICASHSADRALNIFIGYEYKELLQNQNVHLRMSVESTY